MNARIASVGAYVPARRMHNDELATFLDTSDEWIYSHTGIHYRHIAADDQAASDLAVPAARIAMERAGVHPEEIDLVLVATSTPDYVGLPSTACVVQDKLGIPSAGAMDVMAACTGFIYGLETARTYIVAGAARNVLLIGTEVYSKIINWEDRRTAVLFGDGAGAVVVQPGNDGDSSRILPAVLGSRGSGAESLYRSHGGTRHQYVPGATPEADLKLKMDGRAVYNFAVSTVVDTIRELLTRNDTNFEAVDWVVPHQANERIINAAAKRAGWSRDRFYVNIAEYANTSAASIPIALNEMYEANRLTRGDLLATVGFGSGLTYGGNLLYW
ncbi:MAG: beta-ketoacyl-ACP synthase III [Alkalispirochaeta sp.]